MWFIGRIHKINRLTDIKLDGATTSALEFDYDKLSRRTKLTYENGVETDYTFELDNDMDTLEQSFDSSSVKYTYGFNAVHELTSQSVDDSVYLWHPSTGSNITYAAANNMNQYPTVGGTTYTYDDNGNLTDDGVFDYTYDAENQLVETDDGSTVTTYIYDPIRRQAQKDVGGTKTRYIYSGWQRIADYDGSGNFLRRFIYGPGLDEALIELDDQDEATYLHHDRAGSIVATTDDTGAILNTYAYSPFGGCDDMSGTSIGYTGQRYDQETGLYYYKNRHYSPSIGRFLQSDPIGFGGGLNLYAYVNNSPLIYIDAFGLKASGPMYYDAIVGIFGHASSLREKDSPTDSSDNFTEWGRILEYHDGIGNPTWWGFKDLTGPIKGDIGSKDGSLLRLAGRVDFTPYVTELKQGSDVIVYHPIAFDDPGWDIILDFREARDSKTRYWSITSNGTLYVYDGLSGFQTHWSAAQIAEMIRLHDDSIYEFMKRYGETLVQMPIFKDYPFSEVIRSVARYQAEEAGTSGPPPGTYPVIHTKATPGGGC